MPDGKLSAAILAAISCYLEQEGPVPGLCLWVEAGRREQLLCRLPSPWPQTASFPNQAWALTQPGGRWEEYEKPN